MVLNQESAQDAAIKKMVDGLDLHIGRNAFKTMKKYSDLTYQVIIFLRSRYTLLVLKSGKFLPVLNLLVDYLEVLILIPGLM